MRDYVGKKIEVKGKSYVVAKDESRGSVRKISKFEA